MSGILYLVATPIGNLADLSRRAIDVLKSVDLIACEDTRHTRKLLNCYSISNKLISYHEHNEAQRSQKIVTDLRAGRSVAIASDAGTPGINDPGFFVVQAAIEAGISIVPIPGAVAFVSAVIASGLPTDALFFGGFLPSKKTERLKRLREVASIPATLLFYESPNRLARSLADCLEVMGPRRAVYARELTKLHEEFVRGDLASLASSTDVLSVKGEIVLVIDRERAESKPVSAPDTVASRVAEIKASGVDQKFALKQAAREFGISKSEAYRYLQAVKDRQKAD
ncbi:MAG: 16S rRNA (cytidine(1402)-2'-O)-methyltransferase [Pyrinomonadaceae bacterium]